MKIQNALVGPALLGVLTLLVSGCASSTSSLPPGLGSDGSGLSASLLHGLEPQHGGACEALTSTRHFNHSPIARGSSIWFTSVISAPDYTRPMQLTMMNSLITFTSGKTHYRIEGPNMRLFFGNNREVRVGFSSLRDHWRLEAPYGTAGNDLLNAMAYQLPNPLPGGITNVAWSAKFYSREPRRLEWRWSAAVYTRIEHHYRKVDVKAIDDDRYPPYNSDRAGTPEAFKQYLTAGGTGDGGRDYTGVLGPKVAVMPCR
jgi:hypothetical protein